MADVSFACTVNGKAVSATVPPRLLLVDFLRERLDLTGTHVGCEHGVCGACTILVSEANGEALPMRACLMFAAQADGLAITTVEGHARDGRLTDLQEAFRRHHALQCGFCTPGMLASAAALLKDNPHPDADEIRDALSGNVCRCTGYLPIIDALLDVSRKGTP